MKRLFQKILVVALLLATLKASSTSLFGDSYSVKFEQALYQVEEGQPITAKIIISPIPSNGLFSYGINIALGGGVLSGNLFSISVPEELSFHSILGSPGDAFWDGRKGFAKGSVNFFHEPFQVYRNATIATISIPSLPQGNYTLNLSFKNDLGTTEQIFVDGANENLDPKIAFSPTQIIVQPITDNLNPDDQEVGGTHGGLVKFNPQTGLFKQTYRLTNPFLKAYTGIRVYLDNLPRGVKVWNGWNVRFDPTGRPYVVYTRTLLPGQSVDLTLEYYVPGRRIKPHPIFKIAAPKGDVPPLIKGPVVAYSRGKRLANRQFLVEFTSKPRQEYYIQYNDNAAGWKTVMPSVGGTGTKIQWIDNGPPKTMSYPNSGRLYRIVKP